MLEMDQKISKSIKLIVAISVLTGLIVLIAFYSLTTNKIYIDGVEIAGDKAVFIGKDIVELPLRTIIEAIGGKFTYLDASPVIIEDGTRDFFIRFDENVYICRFSMEAPYHQDDIAIILDGENFYDNVQLGNPGKIGEGRIYKDKVYLYESTARILLSHFGYDVKIDFDKCIVYITSGVKQNYMQKY